MIDNHTHTHYSKHATGSIEDAVTKAIKNNIKILTISDHAPCYIDSKNRLLSSELDRYLQDIERVKAKYQSEITILTGLEVDFILNDEKYVETLLANINIDYVIGAIHYVFLDNKIVNVWDISQLNNERYINEYFSYLSALTQSNLFDAIAHPDTILRGGIPEQTYYKRFLPLIPAMKRNGLAYELNCSGPYKSVFDVVSNTKQRGKSAYPSQTLVSELNRRGIDFTIGSDAHHPTDIGRGIRNQLKQCLQLDIDTIVYYQQRQKRYARITDLL